MFSTVRSLRAKTLSLTVPSKKKPIGVKSGKRGGHLMAPQRPIYLLENSESSSVRTSSAKWSGAPSC